MNAGGACIGCTMPGFPDKFTPFYRKPPGTLVSSNVAKAVGSVMRPMRAWSNMYLNRETRWDVHHDIPSGWAREKSEPSRASDFAHKFYEMWRRANDTGKHRGDEWGKRREWTERKSAQDDTESFSVLEVGQDRDRRH